MAEAFLSRKLGALLLAAGQGIRFGGLYPKQFMTLHGRSLVEWTVRNILQISSLQELVIVLPREKLAQFGERLKAIAPELIQICDGGSTRHESIQKGLKSFKKLPQYLTIHEAARPNASLDVFYRGLKALDGHDAVVPVIASSDSLLYLRKGRIDLADRSEIWRIQTPEFFRFKVAEKLLDTAFETTPTTLFEMALRQGFKVGHIQGERGNIKIDTSTELALIEPFFTMAQTLPPPLEKMKLSGKRALIFGGTGAIGSAIVKQLSSHGADVHACGSNIRLHTPNALSSFFDQKWDIIIHSAGSFSKENKTLLKPFVDSSEEEREYALNLLYRSAWQIMELASKTMPGGGHVVFIGSSAAFRGRKDFTLYAPAKSSLINFVQGVAEEFASKKIFVNIVSPQRTQTPMRKNLNENNIHPILSPHDVAHVVGRFCQGNVWGEHYHLRNGQKIG